ncbi:MAG: NAD(+) diphosphatase [Rhodobacteraceae bacterium]|nr:NAD(+) diphosphatase [Alphaproteobacteria bacterium]MBT8474173.1 NAD(+) diphosphatase [Alphaproteobacteria bacterium]NNF71787.1 NAD(+) diphosphatase [Paracoccaceae bacterium]NNK65781.1 NAD(+) diphosphatase [Paracoccaceae bacterium]
MRFAEEVTFGGSGLNRAGEVRADAEKVAALWADPAARVLPIWRGKPLFVSEDKALGWLPVGHAVLDSANEAAVFLGLEDAGPRFAIDISDWEPEEVPDTVGAFVDLSEQRHPDLRGDHAFAELRGVLSLLSPRTAELAATAKAILGWHETHGFCARCGAGSEVSQAGWQRTCPACGGHHFPRTDPVVIMLITQGNDVLVGRSPHWPEGMYSLLAGFVEPGETIEAAVRREVFEEAGITVGEVGYLASQPWPFPSSLMIGCHGVAQTREITLDPVELDDALWVSRERMTEVYAGRDGGMTAARKGSIANFLIGRWLADRLD